MCCHPKDMYNPETDEFEAHEFTVIQDEPEIVFPPPLIVQPTQEMIDEIADRDEQIAEEGEPV